MKYLIVGLGNIGAEYELTRHNIGFLALDLIAEKTGVKFGMGRHAFFAEAKYKSRNLLLIKPTTYMNLSGKAVNYWMKEENIPLQNILIITDDIALPFAKLRLRPKGSAGGHNGLTNIQEMLGTDQYVRMRMGVGNDFGKGRQADYVLSKFNAEEMKELPFFLGNAAEAALSFTFAGIERTMTQYNK